MIDEHDQKHILIAATNALLKETAKLGKASEQLGMTLKKDDMKAMELMEGIFTVLALNTNVTITLGTVVMAHLQATGMLKTEVKLHS